MKRLSLRVVWCLNGFALVAILWNSGCSSTNQTAAASAAPPPAWPAPPGVARIRYVQSFAVSPGHPSRGFFATLLDVLFGSRDRELPQFKKPSAVAVDSAGNLYATDLANPEVFRIPRDGTAWEPLSAKAIAQLSAPVGIAIRNDTIIVVDAATAKIIFLDMHGDVLRVADPGLQRPTAIVTDANFLYVTDAINCKIAVLDHAGNRLRDFGVRDTIESGLHTPTNLALRNDSLFVVDALNFRVAVFSTAGKFLRSFGIHGDAPGYFSRPRGIAFDPDGHLYVVDAMLDCVQIFSTSGDYLLSFGEEGASDPGQFDLPAGIAIGNDGRIFVADSYNRRVQEFQYLHE